MVERWHGCVAAAGLAAHGVCAQLLAFDDFDSSSNLLAFSVTPDNSADEGYFATGNPFDVFGVTTRAAAVARTNIELLDDSLEEADTFGLLGSTKTDAVFAVADLANAGNADGRGSAEWRFDVSTKSPSFGTLTTQLYMQVSAAAMGGFEGVEDVLAWSVELRAGDGSVVLGETEVLRLLGSDEGEMRYTLEGGGTATYLSPLRVAGASADGVPGPAVAGRDDRRIDNVLRAMSVAMPPTTEELARAEVLVVRLAVLQDDATEVVVFDDLRIAEGDPVNGVLPTGACCSALGCRENETALTCAVGAGGSFFEAAACAVLDPACEPAAPTDCPGDTNNDLVVNGLDFVALLVGFGRTSGATLSDGDFDADGDVDGLDFVEFLVLFGRSYDPADPRCVLLR